MKFNTAGGVHLPDFDLYLDPTRARSHGIITHAHSDHVRRHATADATAATAGLIRERYGRATKVTERETCRPFRHGRSLVTLYPAGHVLGAAQVLVDDGKHRLLYSGDLRLRPSPAAEPCEVPRADVVVVDATFGRRRYVFPPDQVVVASIMAFCQQSLDAGCTPVLLAYSLGKAQEVILHLHEHGFRVAAHASVQRINAVYRQHGSTLPECGSMEEAIENGAVVVAPPQVLRGAQLRSLGRVRTATLTGWAIDSGARFRYRTDAAFPLSDHCGFDDILRYVELTGAREVYPVFGDASELVRELQLRGISAAEPGKPFQPALPGLT